MSHLVTTLDGQSEEISAWRTHLNTLITNATFRVRLFKNNIVPDMNSVLATFTEANFTGYTDKVPPNPFGAVFTNGSNQAEIDGPDTLTWTTTDAVVPNTIYGYFIYDTAAAKVLWAEQFDVAGVGLDMTVAGKVINLTLKYTGQSKF